MTLSVLVGALVLAATAKPHGNAGVVAYACVENRALVLLAFDSEPGRQAWATLGGHPKASEPIWETAIREFEEESNCAYDDEKKRPTPSQLATVLYSRAPNGFYSYVAEVSYIPVKKIKEPRRCDDVERSRWVWVDYTALVAALDQDVPRVPVVDGTPANIQLWNENAAALRKAIHDSVLPKTDPCAAQQGAAADTAGLSVTARDTLWRQSSEAPALAVSARGAAERHVP